MLSFAQAQARAQAWQPDGSGGGLTVERACEQYVENKRAEDGDKAADAEAMRLRRHVLRVDVKGKALPGRPGFGKRTLVSLTAGELEAWRNALVTEPGWMQKLMSKSAANRVLSVWKASMNAAFAKAENGIENDVAWRKGLKKFTGKDVRVKRPHHSSEEQVSQLLEAARAIDPAFADYLQGCFLLGVRPPSEIAPLKVRHLHVRECTLHIPGGKTGSRNVLLGDEALEFMQRMCAGKAEGDLIFTRQDGEPWNASLQLHRFRECLKAAKLPKAATCYSMRHSNISRSIERGMPLSYIGDQCGTSVGQIEEHYRHIIERVKLETIRRTAPRLQVIEGGRAVA